METAGVKANAHTFGAMIDGCARAGQLPKAFGAYGIMMAKVQRSFFLFLAYTVPWPFELLRDFNQSTLFTEIRLWRGLNEVVCCSSYRV